MPGKVFVTAFLLFMLAFIALAVLFNFYPPAANSWWTALGVAVYAAVSVLTVRRVARR
jgi:multisubunit Na+/H+ antiporter MnhB subunit